jgi:subtilisin family serine protease
LRRGFEALESRVLLSVPDLADATRAMGWYGVERDVVPDRWLVGFDEAIDQQTAEVRIDALADMLGVGVTGVRLIGSGYNAVFETGRLFTEAEAVWATQVVDGVSSLNPDEIYQTGALPDDPLFSEEWQLENTGQVVPGSGAGTPDADVDAVLAWDLTVGSSDVIVAVIDTGVDMDHPDLIANIWTNPGEIPGNGIDDDGNGFVDDVNGWDFGDLGQRPRR